jgi:protein TonB
MKPGSPVGAGAASAWLRWCICFVIVACVHGGGAWALLARPDLGEPSDADPAILMDFVAMPLAQAPARDVAPDVIEQVQTEAAAASNAEPAEAVSEPQEMAELKPVTEAEPVEKAQPPREQKPDEQAQAAAEEPMPTLPTLPEAEVALATAPPPAREAEKVDDEANKKKPPPASSGATASVTTAPSAASAPNASMVSWKTRLARHIQRYKRYPEAAQRRGERGTAVVQFTVDRQGRVISTALVRGSGSRTLDDETMALVHRAEPFPRPPADARDSQFSFTVPVRFSAR